MNLRMPIDRDTFRSAYWQKRPLLMRGAVSADAFSLPPEELAGLACEPDVESRLVIEQPDGKWSVEHGPVAEHRFTSLPETHWTLLVQDVDKYRDDVAALLELFDFVPGWRIDDIMISFASDGGGVGPHTDSYDVFLMQAQGRRRWRVSDSVYSDEDLLADQPLRLLSRFEVTDDWLLEPGDILYLPPGVAHWGTADGNCMTYSLGFRAPQGRELVAEWLQHLAERADATPLIDQSEGHAPAGVLSPGFIVTARTTCTQAAKAEHGDFIRWLGQYVTEPKPSFQIEFDGQTNAPASIDDWLRHGGTVRRHPWARLCWASTGASTVALFGNGRCWEFDSSFETELEQICSKRCIGIGPQIPTLTPRLIEVLTQLLNVGLLEMSQTPCRYV